MFVGKGWFHFILFLDLLPTHLFFLQEGLLIFVVCCVFMRMQWWILCLFTFDLVVQVFILCLYKYEMIPLTQSNQIFQLTKVLLRSEFIQMCLSWPGFRAVGTRQRTKETITIINNRLNHSEDYSIKYLHRNENHTLVKEIIKT